MPLTNWKEEATQTNPLPYVLLSKTGSRAVWPRMRPPLKTSHRKSLIATASQRSWWIKSRDRTHCISPASPRSWAGTFQMNLTCLFCLFYHYHKEILAGAYYSLVYVYVYVCVCVRGRDNLEKAAFSFYYMSPVDGTQVSGLKENTFTH